MIWLKYLPIALVIAFVVFLYWSNQNMKEQLVVLKSKVVEQEHIIKNVQDQAKQLSNKISTLNKNNDIAEGRLNNRRSSSQPHIAAQDDEINEIGKSIESLSR